MGSHRFMSVRFWKENTLCRVFICRSGLPSPNLNGELGSLARLLSSISPKVDIVASSGCPADFIRVVDQSDYFSKGVQSCFRFSQFSLETLMHKSSRSSFGHIGFFSVLRGLVISLGGSLREEWAMRSPELSNVSDFFLL